MRGKKTDSEFLSSFITQCIRQGMETPEAIAGHARKMVGEIDEEIKRVEKQRLIRSKLLDVISAFDKPIENNKNDEIRALAFFKIQSPNVCKYICDKLKAAPCAIEGFTRYSKEDIVFAVKQLLEHKVINKSGDFFLRGDSFEDYLKFVLRE